MNRDVLAVLRHLPEHRLTIEKLMLRSDAFRSLCADLAEAERALRGWEGSTQAVGHARSAEYRVLVADLEGELRAMVEAATGTRSPAGKNLEDRDG